jgi:hypothetical protein
MATPPRPRRSTITARAVPDAPAPLCLDYGVATAGVTEPAAGAVVGVSPCGPGDGSLPYDRSQRWALHADATLRPFADASLCATNFVRTTSNTSATPVTLEPCDARVSQHWAYHGGAPGNEAQEDDGYLEFGDCANALGIIAVAQSRGASGGLGAAHSESGSLQWLTARH